MVRKTFQDYWSDPEFRKKVKEHGKKKVTCGCGVETTKRNLSHHKQTKTHRDWIHKNEQHAIGKSFRPILEATVHMPFENPYRNLSYLQGSSYYPS